MPSFLSVSVKNSNSTKYIYETVSCNSSRVRVKIPAKAGILKKITNNKKNDQVPIGGYPDISRPHQDCYGCGGSGCSRCS